MIAWIQGEPHGFQPAQTIALDQFALEPGKLMSALCMNSHHPRLRVKERRIHRRTR